MGKDSFYFFHDYNSRNDRKMLALAMKHGMAGIGVYWCVVEMLYEESGFIPIEYERIAFELRIDTDVIQSVINDFGLFEKDDDHFWSEAVLTRLQERCKKSEKARTAIETRWARIRDKYDSNTDE
jgi:hypothetical protein